MQRRLAMTCLLTLRCNFKCPYCDQAREKPYLDYPDISGTHWKKLFSAVPNALIHLSGGEPFLHPDFLEIIENMPKRHLVYIATNLSMPLRNFLNVARVEQIFFLAASLHPSAQNFSLKVFLRNLDLLQQHGIPAYVNYVAYPEQIPLIPQMKKAVEEHGAIFNVDPFMSKTYVYTEHEKQLVEGFLTQERKVGWPWYEEGQQKYCTAGKEYFFVAPNGEAYRCSAGFFHHGKKRFYLGNIKSNFKLNEKAEPCYNSCPSTCDQSAVTVFNKDGEVVSKPLYSSELLLQAANKLNRYAAFRYVWNKLPQKRILSFVRQ